MNIGTLRTDPRFQRWGLFLLGLIVLLNMIWSAWLCDDAFISFRHIYNAVHGYGLTFNPIERVQAYTHPLWVLLLLPLYAITRDIVYTPMIFSIVISGWAIWRMLRVVDFRFDVSAMLLLAALASRSFMDYTSSGLENPLTFLCLAFFLGEWVGRRRSLVLALIAALCLMNRLDTALFFFFPLLNHLWQQRSWRTVGQLALGFVPLIAWELFSLIYYGFPFPNTAYAKLSTRLPAEELVAQGFKYLQFTLENDPGSLIVIGMGLVAGLLVPRTRWLAVGLILNLVYIVKVGGDFMGGRFLTNGFWLALGMLAFAVYDRKLFRLRWAPMLGLALLGLSLFFSPPVLTRPLPSEQEVDVVIAANGIADERAFYAPHTNLIHRMLHPEAPLFRWYTHGEEVRASGETKSIGYAMGFHGFAVGPRHHLLDHMALTDPLLARLPMIYDPNWRIGHFVRVVPKGYFPTILDAVPTMEDPALQQYAEKLRLVTRGPIWTRERFAEIIRFNLGHNAHLINSQYYRFPIDHRLKLEDLSQPHDTIIYLDHFAGAEIDMGGVRVDNLQFYGRCCGEYQLLFWKANEVVHFYTTRVDEERCPLARCPIEVNLPSVDRLMVIPLSDMDVYPLEGITINED